MQTKTISKTELKEYIGVAFEGDEDLLSFYDKGEKIKTVKEACENVYQKIEKLYPECYAEGIEKDGIKIGYFVYESDLLISFSINKKYRTKDYLILFFELIKSKLTDTFQCALYAYNTRAIDWLIKCGMQPILTNITILSIG